VRSRGRLRSARGYTLVEILIAAAILAVALLAIANMFPTGYTNVTEAGRRTMSLTAAKQILEDTRSLPFDNVTALNGFDSTNPATLPVNQPERNIARRWRYTLAGEGDGFTYIQAERDQWATLSTAVPLGGSAQVSVVAVALCPTAPCPPNPVTASGTLQLVTVTISFQAKAGSFQLATLVTRM
jgi:prepilin-type N-terminal cleavage/methylation domain-containing protein